MLFDAVLRYLDSQSYNYRHKDHFLYEAFVLEGKHRDIYIRFKEIVPFIEESYSHYNLSFFDPELFSKLSKLYESKNRPFE